MHYPPNPSVTYRALAAVAAGLLALALALAGPPQSNAQSRVLFVDASTGSDADTGSQTAPLKSLGKALALANAGVTVKLAAGAYGPGGLEVPSGVTIEGATEGGFPVATLVGQVDGAGLRLAGNATVRNLFVGGGAGVGVGIFAKQGTHTLSNVFVLISGKGAVIDGLPLGAGIALRGTAKATLTGSTLFSRGTGVHLLEQSRLTMRGGQINVMVDGASGVRADQQARVTIDGTKIVGTSGAPCSRNSGVIIDDSSQAVLKNHVTLTNLTPALRATSNAQAVMADSEVTRASGPGCGQAASVEADRSASVTVDRSTITATGGPHTVGIDPSGTANVALRDTKLRGHTLAGLDIGGGNPRIRIDGGIVSGNAFGIRHRVTGLPAITITKASFAQNDIGMQLTEAMLKVRGSNIVLNRIGIESRGSLGGLPTRDAEAKCVGACVNLGTDRALPGPSAFDDPGNNNLSSNTQTALDLTFASGSVLAVGNVWNANTQGADGAGRYPQPLNLPGSSPLALGTNFRATPFNQILLGASPVIGTFKLAPRKLVARAGRVARLRLAWTHPVDWKRLDQVVLRLSDRGTPVGRIALDPHTGRLRARGAAVRSLRGRIGHAGKRVSARLAMRIAKRYAGHTLVAKLSATDDDGNRQAFRTAGHIRVMR